MDANISRRDFIKTTSATAAGATLMSFAPWASGMDKKRALSRVVIAKDATCVGNQAKVQTLVDNAIKLLTGVTDTPKAYEALFPAGKLTTSTTILIKYCETVSKTTDFGLIALQNGLKSMLGGFPAANIKLINTGSDASTLKFSAGGAEHIIRKVFVDNDYFINYAPCTNWGNKPALRMGLKNMITAITKTRSTFHNTNLATISSQEIFKTKQILVLTDGIQVQAVKDTNIPGYTIIASKDMVACEYQGVQLLKRASNNSFNSTNADAFLTEAAGTQFGVGTNDPAQMEVISWDPTNIFSSSGDLASYTQQIEIITSHRNTLFKFPKELGAKNLISVYTIHGRKIWEKTDFQSGAIWGHTDQHNNNVPAGVYIYQIRFNKAMARGQIVVR